MEATEVKPEDKTHPYWKEVALICSLLAACELEPVSVWDGGETFYTRDVPPDQRWRLIRDNVLAVDISNFTVRDELLGKEAVIGIVLGNEPGVAINDWQCPDGSMFARISSVSTLVNETLEARVLESQR